jgi:hypothetical protein
VIVDEKFLESDRKDLKMGNRDFVFPLSRGAYRPSIH